MASALQQECVESLSLIAEIFCLLCVSRGIRTRTTTISGNLFILLCWFDSVGWGVWKHAYDDNNKWIFWLFFFFFCFVGVGFSQRLLRSASARGCLLGGALFWDLSLRQSGCILFTRGNGLVIGGTGTGESCNTFTFRLFFILILH